MSETNIKNNNANEGFEIVKNYILAAEDLRQYQGRLQAQRRKDIFKAYQDSGKTFAEIGKIFGGVSRQRIAAIVKSEEKILESEIV